MKVVLGKLPMILAPMLVATSAWSDTTAPISPNWSPSASEILSGLQQQTLSLRNDIYNIVTDAGGSISHADFDNLNFKIKIVKNDTGKKQSVPQRSLKITLVSPSDPDGISISTDPSVNYLGAQFSDILNQVYPNSTDLSGATVHQWQGGSGSFAGIKNINTDIDNVINWCDTQIKKTSRDFWFEVLPVHLYCRGISKPNLQSYQQTIWMKSAMDTSTNLLDGIAFATARDQAAAEIAVGAILYQAQVYINGNPAFLRNRARCFPVGRPFNETVLGSIAVPFNVDSSGAMTYKKVGDMAMPEPFYALGGYKQYYDDPRRAVFNNRNNSTDYDPAKFPTIPISSETYKTFKFNTDGVLYFLFHLRDVYGGNHCSGPPFCQTSPVREENPDLVPDMNRIPAGAKDKAT